MKMQPMIWIAAIVAASVSLGNTAAFAWTKVQPLALEAKDEKRVPAKPMVERGYEEPMPTKTISNADLNLRTPAGQEALNARMKGAVRSLCHTSKSTIPLEKYTLQRQCTRDTLAGVRAQVAAAIQGAGSSGSLAAAATVVTIVVKQ